MILAMIVAIDENNGIGKEGDQLAYISNDLKRFKVFVYKIVNTSSFRIDGQFW